MTNTVTPLSGHQTGYKKHRVIALSIPVLALLTIAPLFLFVHRSSASSPRCFRIVFRVVHPHWRIQPTSAQLNQFAYFAVVGNQFRLDDPLSESEFLRKLNEANPKLAFEKVSLTKKFMLNADEKWQQPKTWSINLLSFAIVEHDRSLLRVEPDASRATNDFIVSKVPGKPQTTKVTTIPVVYKLPLSPSKIRQIIKEGNLILSFRVKQRYRVGARLEPFHDSDLCQITRSGNTVCLTNDLPVVLKPHPQIASSDCIFVTVEEIDRK